MGVGGTNGGHTTLMEMNCQKKSCCGNHLLILCALKGHPLCDGLFHITNFVEKHAKKRKMIESLMEFKQKMLQ